MNCSRSSTVCEPPLRRRLEKSGPERTQGRGMAANATVIPPSEPCEYEMVLITLPYADGLSISGSQTLPAVIGNGAVDDGAAIDAFPGVEHEKEI
jgi:hypothetical protein